jgi:short subunit dehydrogenase-like uncharacterized protein
MSTYGISWILLGNLWSLTQAPRAANAPSTTPFLSHIFGYRNIPGLGTLTTTFFAICNESIVHRSAALLSEIYGPNFLLHEFLPVAKFFAAVLFHFLTRLGLLMVSFPPLRALIRLLIPPAGTGPDLSTTGVQKQGFHTVGTLANKNSKKVEAKFSYEGSLYYCSAAMGIEASLVILSDEKISTDEIGGGILTPATLGMPFVERLRNIGAVLEVKTVV